MTPKLSTFLLGLNLALYGLAERVSWSILLKCVEHTKHANMFPCPFRCFTSFEPAQCSTNTTTTCATATTTYQLKQFAQRPYLPSIPSTPSTQSTTHLPNPTQRVPNRANRGEFRRSEFRPGRRRSGVAASGVERCAGPGGGVKTTGGTAGDGEGTLSQSLTGRLREGGGVGGGKLEIERGCAVLRGRCGREGEAVEGPDARQVHGIFGGPVGFQHVSLFFPLLLTYPWHFQAIATSLEAIASRQAIRSPVATCWPLRAWRPTRLALRSPNPTGTEASDGASAARVARSVQRGDAALPRFHRGSTATKCHGSDLFQRGWFNARVPDRCTGARTT